jgi:RimJ/RimL family protein N-acetyltransferase
MSTPAVTTSNAIGRKLSSPRHASWLAALRSSRSASVVVVETPRLILRRLTLDDAGFILRLLNEPSFLEFIGDKGVRTLDDACDYMLKGPIGSYEEFGFGLYRVELKEQATPVGMCGLVKRETLSDVDVGFAFLPEFWSKGYAIESASAVLEFARTNLRLTRLVGIARPDNHASIRVLEKLGMKFEQRIRVMPDGPEDVLYGVNLNDS